MASVIPVQKAVEYQLKTTNGSFVHIVFCHKEHGDFKHGLTSETIVEMMVDRQSKFTNPESDENNINALNHLKLALSFIKARDLKKQSKK